jgi:hypothetical protein
LVFWNSWVAIVIDCRDQSKKRYNRAKSPVEVIEVHCNKHNLSEVHICHLNYKYVTSTWTIHNLHSAPTRNFSQKYLKSLEMGRGKGGKGGKDSPFWTR